MLALLKETWVRIQADLKSRAGDAAYDAWLQALRPLALERGTVYLESENRMACDRVQRLYTPLLEDWSTLWLSGMMPSSGIARISCTSSTFSISPRSTREES